MLVLSRKTGERIHIGGDVVITVTKIAGGRAKIGIEAPLEVSIHRGELAAAAADPDSPAAPRRLQREAPLQSNYFAAEC